MTTREALAWEAADLLFHVLVLLKQRDLDPAEVIAALRARRAGHGNGPAPAAASTGMNAAERPVRAW